MKPYIPDKLPLTTGVNLEALIPSIGLANRAIAKYEGILYRSKRQENPIFTGEVAGVIMGRNKEVHDDEEREGISLKGVQLLEGTHRGMAGKWNYTIGVLSAA